MSNPHIFSVTHALSDFREMGHWLSLMHGIALNWHWRLNCPDTIEEIAQDFHTDTHILEFAH
jgi:hypothetical protein